MESGLGSKLRSWPRKPSGHQALEQTPPASYLNLDCEHFFFSLLPFSLPTFPHSFFFPPFILTWSAPPGPQSTSTPSQPQVLKSPVTRSIHLSSLPRATSPPSPPPPTSSEPPVRLRKVISLGQDDIRARRGRTGDGGGGLAERV
ncbi:hypothetical protein E2C01_093286 [Portunus trituberculatus]|uniref:Uncharacterized protein n=1 Tax=Portunus trituberculatus TaxID=210409 RepID=A0A5B7JMC4_PORTR|nr:hypothetical protein [Portunus trituberculatus]